MKKNLIEVRLLDYFNFFRKIYIRALSNMNKYNLLNISIIILFYK